MKIYLIQFTTDQKDLFGSGVKTVGILLMFIFEPIKRLQILKNR